MVQARLTREQLVGEYRAHHTPREAWLVGGEFERAVVRPDGRPVGYHDPDGIRFILESLAAQDGWDLEREGEFPIALWKGRASITLEPGGQVELSGAPHRTLGALAEEAAHNRRALHAVTAGRDLAWIACGLTPIAAIEDIPWVPKGRYQVMREFLPHYGDLAHYMMKGTCSVQVNLDYDDEADCARKVRMAAGIAPLTTALFANSPLYRNQPTGFRSYRSHIWTRTDPHRTGFPPALRQGYSHGGWVDYLLDVPMMFYKIGGRWTPARGRTFRDYMATGLDGHFPDRDEWVLHQTSVFPEVRVKRTIEVRGADFVDHDLSVAFCALYVGLMYDGQALSDALDLVAELEPHGTHTERLAAAAREGLQARVGGRTLADWARELGALADQGLGRAMPADRALLDPLLRRIDAGRSPADELLEAWHRDPDPLAIVRHLLY